ADSLAFVVAGRRERAEAWLDTIMVNTAAGVQTRVYRFLRTPYGPVIARHAATAFAVSLAGMEEGGSLQQWLAMGRARSIDEFRPALARRALPGLATAYADTVGNIMSDDGRGGASVLNPEGGEVRVGASRSGRVLRADSGWTVPLLARLALGTAPLNAATEVQQLVQEWEQVGGHDSRRAFALDTAVELLRRWNGRTGERAVRWEAGDAAAPAAAADSAASFAATLYYMWQEAYRATRTSGAAGATTGSPFPRFQALEGAVASLRQDWGRITVPWSEALRLQRPDPSVSAGFRDTLPSIPLTGFPDGTLFVLNSAPGGARRRYAASGTAAVLVTEFTARPRAASVVVFGASGRPASRHFFDQATKYAAGELKEVRFGKGEPGRTRYHPGQRELRPETPPQR
ncbi:MAG: penicillin acylase family protein, partial [Gemmatimonadetes bacterium]|nr:penicillin acylase family protein [Gemmatimonadota bacterium]